jgi:hypothetical protein
MYTYQYVPGTWQYCNMVRGTWSRECCRTARTRGAATSKSASTAIRGSSTSAWCAPRPSAMSTRGNGTTPGLAAEAYAAVRAAKYADQGNFIPFIMETGGRVNKAARDWLSDGSRARRASAQPGRHGTRRRGRPLRPFSGRRCRRWCACRPTCLRGLWWRSALQTSLS